MKNKHENQHCQKHGNQEDNLKPLESVVDEKLDPIPSHQPDAAEAERAADDMCAEEQAMNATDLMRRLDDAVAQAEKNKDLYMHTLADLDTYRRKVQREKQELAQFAVQPLIEELIPSVDHLEMAIAAARASADSKNLLQGVEMVCAQIKKVLSNFGVEEITGEGGDFDPNVHECVAHNPSDSVPENKIIKVMRSGYKIHGRLVRPASVVVSSGKQG